jgi:radical SAM superfamily enzyme YgiQ (UPF0313 family)
MKFLLIYPDFCFGSRGKYYEGAAIISAMLKQAGHKVSFLHLNTKVSADYICDAIKENSPDLIGFSSTSHMFFYIAECAKVIKKKFNIPIICGGKHPTLCPDSAISEEGLDMICVGEGEYAIVELCDSLEHGKDIDKILNIWVKKSDGTIAKNEIRPLVEDLSSLPLPDRGIFNEDNFLESDRERINVLAIRGCPYDCTYCSNQALRKIYAKKGRYIRRKSIDYILEEINLGLKKNPKAKYVNFNDDILALDKNWFKDLVYAHKARYNLPYECNAKFDLIDEEIVNIFKDTGCQMLSFGLESGNDYIRNKVLNRKMTKAEMVKAAGLCKCAGIKIFTYNMVGIPEERLADILDTVKLNANIEPIDIHVSVFAPYRGTALYDKCMKEGSIKGSNFLKGSYFEQPVLELKGLKPQEIEFAVKNFGNFFRYYIQLKKIPSFLKPLFGKMLDILWLKPNLYIYLMGIRLSLKRKETIS